MTEIKYDRKSPTGVATIDTRKLVVGTDGRIFAIHGSRGTLVELDADARRGLEAHFGRATVAQAVEAVEALA